MPDIGGLTLALEIGTILRLARLVELVILAMLLEIAYGISLEISSPFGRLLRRLLYGVSVEISVVAPQEASGNDLFMNAPQ